MRRERELKKKWSKPKLIVLVRGKPEEWVLSNCKGLVAGSPNNTAANCGVNLSPLRVIGCTVCSVRPVGGS